MAQALDFSPLDIRNQIYQDRRLKAELTSDIINTATSAAMDVADWQRDMRQKFAEASEFDSDITMDAQANAWLGNYYENKVKNEEVQAIVDKRWKNQSHVNKMLAVKKQGVRTAQNMKALVDARSAAEEKASGDQALIYEVDSDKVRAFEDLLTGKVDVKNPNAYMMGLAQGENGEAPFLKLRRNDIDPIISQKSLELAAEYEEIKKIAKEQVVGENIVTTVKEQRIIDQIAKDQFGGLVLQSIMQDPKLKGTLPTYALDSKEKIKSAGMASTGNINDMQMYVAEVFDYSDILEPKTRVTSVKTEPKPEEKDKDGGVVIDPESYTDPDKRKKLTLNKKDYLNMIVFPKIKTDEKVDVLVGARKLNRDGSLSDPEDITDVSRIVGYDASEDVIVSQDKYGDYYESPRESNDDALKVLVHKDSYNDLIEFRSKAKADKQERAEGVIRDIETGRTKKKKTEYNTGGLY